MKYIHIIINSFLIMLFVSVAEFSKRDFFTVSEMLDIGDTVDVLIVLIFVHLIFISAMVKHQKTLNIAISLITLGVYLFYPVSFNPF